MVDSLWRWSVSVAIESKKVCVRLTNEQMERIQISWMKSFPVTDQKQKKKQKLKCADTVT